MDVVAEAFRSRRVRANPRYQFVTFEQLSAEQLNALGDRVLSTDFAGVFLGDGSDSLSIKAAPAHLANLTMQLRTPMVVESVLPELAPIQRDETLAGLVLEGLLEVEGHDGFVGQSAAYSCVARRSAPLSGEGTLASLATRALAHAERLCIRDVETLAAKLYFYHRAPITARSTMLWRDRSAVLRFLEMETGGPFARTLSSGYEMTASSNTAWIYWKSKERPSGEPGETQRYKLYVSPHAEHLKEAFAVAAELLPDSRATGIKVGSDAGGLLRPDKLLVYFASQRDLSAYAHALRPRLTGLPAHGVPFTSPIDDDGLLSWGIDPVSAEGRVGLYVDDSWRTWLCNRLAIALVACGSESSADVSPARYALTRLWLMGIDTRSWCWRANAGSVAESSVESRA